MRKVWALFYRKQQSLGSATFVLMCMVIISGLLGLIRLRILYNQFTPAQTGLFFAAFRIPNLIFELLAMGSLTAAFIPVFSKFLARDEDNQANHMASTVINIALIICIAVAIPVFIWTDEISKLLVPGFTLDQIKQVSSYTRFILFFQVVPLVAGNFFTGILQSYNLFIIPAIAPLFYNIGIITGISLLSGTLGLFSAVVGVGIGAALFALVQIPALYHIGYKHRLSLSLKIPGVKEVGRLVGPRMVGLGVSQIDLTVDLILSSLLGAKMVSVFFLAQSLAQLPIRLYGSSIAQAILPSLSKSTAKDDLTEYKSTIIAASHMILFLILPTSALFMVLRIPIIRLVYGAAYFDWEATVLTAQTLTWFSLSLFSQALAAVFTRGFYALYDSKTPVIIGVFTIILNTLLSLIFIIYFKMPVWSLALSTTIGSFVNMSVLFTILYRKIGGFNLSDILFKPLKIALVTGITAIVVYIPMKLMDQLVFDTTRVFGLLALTFTVGSLGLMSYIFLSWVLNITQVQSFLTLYSKLQKLRQLITQPSSEIISEESTNP